jgi:ribosomal protein L17
MTVRRPGTVVHGWIETGLLRATDPDSRLEELLTEAGVEDITWRHEALCALRIFRREAETGEPF